MARTRSTIKGIINSKLQQVSGTLSDANFNNALNMALDSLQLEIDFPESERTYPLMPVFRGQNAYTPPSDLKGDAILSIRPWISSDVTMDTNLDKNQTGEFDRNLFWLDTEGKLAIEYDQGTKILRLFPHFDQSVNYTLHDCNTYNQNGTWTADTATSDAANVATDAGLFVQGSGSVKFDIIAAQTVSNFAQLSNSTMSAVNVSAAIRGKSSVFLDTYFPTSSAYTSITLRFGSSAANYFTKTITAPFIGSFKQYWNTLAFDFQTATQVGTPDLTALNYLNYRMDYAGSLTDQVSVRIDNIVLRDGALYEIKYYTNNVVQDVGGTKKQYFTADDDTSILTPETEVLFIDYATGYIAPNAVAPSGSTFSQIAARSLENYARRFPTKRKRTVRNWYM